MKPPCPRCSATDDTDRTIRAYLKHRRPHTIEQHVEAAIGPEPGRLILCFTVDTSRYTEAMHRAEQAVKHFWMALNPDACLQSFKVWRTLPAWRRWWELLKP